MKTRSEKIAGILARAEHDLRVVIADAASEGDYEGVDLARDIAAQLGAMMPQTSCPVLLAKSAVGENGVGQDFVAPTLVTRNQVPDRKNKAGVYPRFLIRNGVLAKYGWSKKSKKEYTHKIPKDVFDQTIDALKTIASSGISPITAEQISGQIGGNVAVPIYQVYVALAFLRQNRLVMREGRDGYVIGPEFTRRVDTLWRQSSGSPPR